MKRSLRSFAIGFLIVVVGFAAFFLAVNITSVNINNGDIEGLSIDLDQDSYDVQEDRSLLWKQKQTTLENSTEVTTQEAEASTQLPEPVE